MFTLPVQICFQGKQHAQAQYHVISQVVILKFIDKAMPRLIVLLLIVTLVVGFQLQAQPSSLAILGEDTCQLTDDSCPINKGTTPVCSYYQSCDSRSCTVHFCLYASGLNGMSHSLTLHFNGGIFSIYSPLDTNKNCKYTGMGTNTFAVNCSCFGKCYLQANYVIKYTEE